MNLKELIKEVERLKTEIKDFDGTGAKYGLKKTRQTVEAVDNIPFSNIMPESDLQDWLKLKKLLDIKD